VVSAGAEERDRMTDEVAARIAALKAMGEDSAEKAVEEREPSKNWNKGVKEGDMLAGMLVRGDKVWVESRNESTYLMEIRDHETKELYTVWCSAFMLNEAIIEKAPAEGSLVVVEFHGKQEIGNGRTMGVFTVEVEKKDFEYWTNVDRVYNKKRFDQLAKKAAGPDAPSFGPDEAPF
jgi:hypothetical protein